MMNITQVRYVYLSQNQQIIHFHPTKCLKIETLFLNCNNIFISNFYYNVILQLVESF